MAKFNFEPLIAKLDRLNQRGAFVSAVRKNKKAIIRLNLNQLDLGRDANNKSLGTYKNPKYKHKTGPVNLLWSGAFRRAFQVDVDDTGITIYSIDVKTDMLVEKYGEDIFGLNVSNARKLMQLVRPDFEANLKKNANIS